MGLFSKYLTKKFTKSFTDIVSDLDKLAKDLENVDFDKEVEKMQDTMSKEFSKLKKLLKKKQDKYVLEVKYDRDTQTMCFELNNKIFTVTVNENSENGSFTSKHTTTVTIPDDVCVDKITQKYDKERKMMLFIMKRAVQEIEDEEVETVEDDGFEKVGEETPKEVKDTEKVKPKNSEELMAVIMKMYQEGQPYTAIAAEVGLSDKTVAKYVKREILRRELEEK